VSILGLGSTNTDNSQMIELRAEQVSLVSGGLALSGGYTLGTVLGDAYRQPGTTCPKRCTRIAWIDSRMLGQCVATNLSTHCFGGMN
jgi:hypothetical protein